MRPLEATDRGLIVCHRQEFAVVWWSGKSRHVVFPIEEPAPAFAGDVPIGADLALFAGRVVRVRKPFWLARDGRAPHGAVPGHVIERMAASIARLTRERSFADVWLAWADAPRHREEPRVLL